VRVVSPGATHRSVISSDHLLTNVSAIMLIGSTDHRNLICKFQLDFLTPVFTLIRQISQSLELIGWIYHTMALFGKMFIMRLVCYYSELVIVGYHDEASTQQYS